MPKDLATDFLQLRIDKARKEIKEVLDKHDLLLSAELNYLSGGILPIIKLVERKAMSEEIAEQPVVETPVQEKAPAEAAE